MTTAEINEERARQVARVAALAEATRDLPPILADALQDVPPVVALGVDGQARADDLPLAVVVPRAIALGLNHWTPEHAEGTRPPDPEECQLWAISEPEALTTAVRWRARFEGLPVERVVVRAMLLGLDRWNAAR